jgi:undecaprenyl-diphosphatase
LSVSPLQAAVLGIVQGLTEFLPVSSSGHLILVPWLFGWPDHSLAFDAGIHLGTVLALLAYFWRDWLELIGAVTAGLRDAAARADPRWRIAGLLLLGSIPAGLSGLALESSIEQLIRQPWLVAMLLIVFGLALLAADRLGSQSRGIQDIGVTDALVVGLAQVLALAPGVSRSGITITAAMFVGLDRAAAARFSFLLSTPITLAAALFSMRKLFGSDPAEIGLLVIGIVSATIFGFLAIGFLLSYLQKNSLASFVWYRLAVGALVLGLSLAGVRTDV